MDVGVGFLPESLVRNAPVCGDLVGLRGHRGDAVARLACAGRDLRPDTAPGRGLPWSLRRLERARMRQAPIGRTPPRRATAAARRAR